ncbi:MAG: exodeoxyribonuclease VII small subunit [Pirellulaceae bacterium]|nr:exodeoxyribonuclease VII small subunit [Pirellulaceae bacterium]
MSKAKADPENADATVAPTWSFEQALKRLEELVRRLEQGNVPLEQSLTEYAEAVELLRVCQGKLDAAQSRIEVLSGFDANGEPLVRPLGGDADMSLEEKRDARSSRRSADATGGAGRGSRKLSDVDETGQLF